MPDRTAPALHEDRGVLASAQRAEGYVRRTVRERTKEHRDETRRLSGLVEAQHRARPHIAGVVDGDLHVERVVRSERRVASGIGIDAARARDHSHHLHLARGLRGQPPGALQPLEHHGVVERQRRHVGKLAHEPIDIAREVRRRCRRHARDAAGDHDATQEPVTGQPLVEAQQLFAEPEAVRVTEGEARVVQDHADVADVVVEALQLEQHRAERECAWRDGAAREGLEAAAVRQRVAHARVSRDPLGELARLRQRKRFEQLFDALVHEAQTRLEVDDRFAVDAEAEVPRFDDAGVHRADRDLEDAFALHAPEWEGLALVAEVHTAGDVPAERVIARRPELVERETTEIGMAVGHDAEEVVHVALEEARRERLHGQRRHAWVVGRERRKQRQRWAVRGRREDVHEREVARDGARVGGGEELQLEAERGQRGRQDAHLARVDASAQRVAVARDRRRALRGQQTLDGRHAHGAITPAMPASASARPGGHASPVIRRSTSAATSGAAVHAARSPPRPAASP